MDGVVESDNEGFSGSGYLNADNTNQAGIEWAVDVAQAGVYSLAFAYANGAGDRPADLLIGGSPAAAGVSFPSTTEWTTWSRVTVDVTLAAGEHRIVLSATTTDGLANIDHLEVSGAAVKAIDCAGTGGSTGSDGTGGSEGTGSNNDAEDSDDGGDGLAHQYPCDAPNGDYDAVVTGSGSDWDVSGSPYASMFAAMTAALGSGGVSPTNKHMVIVRDSGSIGSDQRLEMPNNVVFNVCATIHVTDRGGSGDRAPVYARNRSHIDIPHLTVTGVPSYGMFFREVDELHLGEVNLLLSGGGIGVRIDNDPSGEGKCWGRCNRVRNIALDEVYVSGNNGHGVETYGVDGLRIRKVTARNVGNAGLLLNATVNATIGTVDGEDVATGNGYATFRIANEAGRIDGSWPAGNIHVGLVRARRGGRGIFCVSDSGGTIIDRVDIAETGGDTMLLENCHNMRVAAESGTVSGSSGIWITQRDGDHTPSSEVVVQNLTVTSGVPIGESKCGINNLICNIATSGSVSACGANTIQARCP